MRTKEEIKKAEWEAMKFLARKFPDKYKIEIGKDRIFLLELNGLGKNDVYWIPVLDNVEMEVK